MAKKKQIEIVILAKDKASKILGGVGNALGTLGKAATVAGGVAITALTGTSVAAFKLAKDAAEIEKVENTWNNLAKSLGETGGDIKSLRKASRGMVKDFDLMRGANKLMSMGLAKSNEHAAGMVEMATQLGMAMGYDATQSVEDFALMLANQSIPRLDTFGISSSVVRNRINELMAADQNLTREQAFMNAVMEQGAVTMGKVGEQGGGAAGSLERLQANMDNLKGEVGKKFLPLLETITERLVETFQSAEVQTAIDNVLLWIDKIVGNESTGLIGFATYLGNGDIVGAFAAIFGVELVNKVVDFYNTFYGYFEKIKNLITYELPRWIRDTKGDVHTELVQLSLKFWMFANKVNNYVQQANSMLGLLSGKIVPVYLNSIPYEGFQSGGSFTVPGTGTGDQPFLLGLEPGEKVNITPRSRVNSRGNQSLILNLHIHSAVNLVDKNYAQNELMPFIEAGLRRFQGAF